MVFKVSSKTFCTALEAAVINKYVMPTETPKDRISGGFIKNTILSCRWDMNETLHKDTDKIVF